MTEKTETKNKPAQEFRAGGVKATIWENKEATDKSFRFSVTFSRSYKKKDEADWQNSYSYGLMDLGNLDIVRTQAYRWIMNQITA